MDVLITGLIFATVALVGYNIYEAIRQRGMKLKPFLTLTKSLKFSDEVSIFLWKTAKHKINQLVNYSKDGQIKQVVGIEIERVSDTLQEKIRSGLPKEYLCFFSYFDKKQKNLGIIKGKDKYLILKAMQTNGDTYSITNTKLIGDLRKVDKIFPFTITGAGYDWVELALDNLPEDIDLLSEMIIELSPPQEDASGLKSKIKEELKSNNKIFIWWPLKPI